MKADTDHVGFERVGEDHVPQKTETEVEAMIEAMIANAPEGHGKYGNKASERNPGAFLRSIIVLR